MPVIADRHFDGSGPFESPCGDFDRSIAPIQSHSGLGERWIDGYRHDLGRRGIEKLESGATIPDATTRWPKVAPRFAALTLQVGETPEQAGRLRSQL